MGLIMSVALLVVLLIRPLEALVFFMGLIFLVLSVVFTE